MISIKKNEGRFSVIIPTLQRSEKLTPLINMYCRHDLVGEVIVINNAQTPLSIEHPKVHILQQSENIYVNPAWNVGASEAKEELLIISNDDIEFDAELISTVHKFMRFPVGIIGPAWSSMNRTRSGRPRFVPAYRLPHGFGTLMFMRRSNYIPIPKELLIIGGDDWLFEHQSHRNWQILGVNVGTHWATTSGKPEFSPVKERDRKLFKEKYHSDDYMRRYQFESRLMYVMKRGFSGVRKVAVGLSRLAGRA